MAHRPSRADRRCRARMLADDGPRRRARMEDGFVLAGTLASSVTIDGLSARSSSGANHASAGFGNRAVSWRKVSRCRLASAIRRFVSVAIRCSDSGSRLSSPRFDAPADLFDRFRIDLQRQECVSVFHGPSSKQATIIATVALADQRVLPDHRAQETNCSQTSGRPRTGTSAAYGCRHH